MLVNESFVLELGGNIQQLTDQPGVAQVETATVVGTVTTGGDAAVTITSAALVGSPLLTNVAVVGGTLQVETATAAGTITGDGNASVVVTAAGMTNSPKTIAVAVLNGDTAATWAGKVRTALAADVDVNAFFTVSGSTTSIILTARTKAANDGTMNISLDNGTCTGITTAGTSANTTAGVASDTAAVVGGKIRSALGAVTAITDAFTVSGSGANVVLTVDTIAANDNTLNIAITNGTCAGLTPKLTSVDTTAGVAPGATGIFTPHFMLSSVSGNSSGIYIGHTDSNNNLPAVLDIDTAVYHLPDAGDSVTIGPENHSFFLGEHYVLSHWVAKGSSGDKLRVTYVKRRTNAEPV